MIKKIINLTKRLIRYQTITGNHKEVKKSFYFIKNYLKNFSINEEEKNNYFSLIITNCSSLKENFDIIYHGHIDVVSPSEKNQFTPKEMNNRIYGRGALDMKGGLAVLLVLLKNLEQEGLKNKRILLLITSDEEIGGTNGTEYLFKKYKFRSKFFITAEGEKDFLLKVKQKGVLMLKISTTTKGGHSAYVWESPNAILELVNIYTQIKSLFPTINTKNHWHSTVNLGEIRGGVAVNSIADFAEMKIDIRFCEPWKSPEEILKKIKKIINKNKAKMSVIYKTNLMDTSLNNKNIQMLNKICKKNLGVAKDLYFNNHCTNDARFANHYKIPAVAFGPIGNNYHARNEYVEIDSLIKCFRILKEFTYSL